MASAATLAMIGAAAGAVTNKKDPLKGALMGAALGGGGGLLAGGSGLAGITPMGAQAATGLTGVPAGIQGGGALLGAAPAAAPSAMTGLLGKATTPAALAAGAQLAGSMTPQQAQSFPLPMRQVSSIENLIPSVPVVRGPSGPMPRMQDDQLIDALVQSRLAMYPVSMGGQR
jgi:hypothetical protein